MLDSQQHLSPTPLEIAVIMAICEKHPSDRISIETQLAAAKVVSRENTGAGFYTRFELQRSSNVAIGGTRVQDLRNGPQVTVEGLNHGMGFILWLSEGFIDCLEGYTYDDSTTALDLIDLEFKIVSS
ncbi:MAG TPA: hypothetical protein VGJ06_00650 [Candidatus Acidoferrum sp.]|jgi:hypothetical protein